MACVKLTHKVSCEILCSGLWSMSLGHSCIRRAWAFKAPGEAGEPLFGNLRVSCDSQALLQKHPWIKKNPQILQLIYLVNLCALWGDGQWGQCTSGTSRSHTAAKIWLIGDLVDSLVALAAEMPFLCDTNGGRGNARKKGRVLRASGFTSSLSYEDPITMNSVKFRSCLRYTDIWQHNTCLEKEKNPFHRELILCRMVRSETHSFPSRKISPISKFHTSAATTELPGPSG